MGNKIMFVSREPTNLHYPKPSWSGGRKLVLGIGSLNAVLLVGWCALFSVPRQLASDPQSLHPSSIAVLTLLFLNSLVFVCCSLFWQHGKNLLLLFVSILLFGTFCDLILNLIVYGAVSDSYIVPHPIYHHALRPGYYRTYFWPDYDERMYVNSFGMRNKEISLRKPKGIYRILVLGDSFCMGKGVPDEAVFSVLLESKLNQSPMLLNRSQKTYQILNFAADTYIPLLEFLQFKHVGIKFQPDMVLQFYDMSDLRQEDVLRKFHRVVRHGDDNNEIILAVPGKDAKDQVGKEAFLAAMDKIFRYRLYFGSLLYRKMGHFYTKKYLYREFEEYGKGLIAYTLEEDQAPFDKQWEQVFESLLCTRELCQENGIIYLLATYPWKHQVPGGGKETGWWWAKWEVTRNLSPFTKLASFSGREGIPFINLYYDFTGYDGNEPLYFQNDIHLTRAGHKLMSEALYRRLIPIIAQKRTYEQA